MQGLHILSPGAGAIQGLPAGSISVVQALPALLPIEIDRRDKLGGIKKVVFLGRKVFTQSFISLPFL